VTPTITPTATSTVTTTSTPTPTPTSTFATGEPLLNPNPATGDSVQLQFVLGSLVPEVHLRVYTTAFRKIYERKISSVGPGPQDIPLELKDFRGTDLANGFYYVVVEYEGARIVGKLIVTR
jgi:hypothetical protein